VFNHPEQHCCACGKGASALPPPRPTSDSPTFSSRANAMCNGADSEVRTTTVEGCEAHCERVRCACFHFRRSVCSFALVLATPSLQPTSRGYVAHLRVGAQPPPQLAARHTGAGCASSPQRQGSPPAFYLYEEPALEWGERLSRCFEAARGMPPWALAVNDSAHQRDGAPPIQLAHGLWLYQALRQHPARTRIPERAALYVVPAYGSLSEATGGCDGQTHLNRMEAAASSLRTSPWFKAAPRRHLLLASTLPEDRNALGALGELAATSGAVALCADSRSCARGFQRRVVIPPLPLPPLATLAVQLQTARQMCGAAAARRRPTSLFFRGLHAKSHEAQELRARLWTLRQLPGAAVKFTRGGSASLEPDTRRWLVAQGWSGGSAVPFNAYAYARAALRSDFCVVVRGDGQNAGRMLVDAVAAGCVPLVIGDKTVLPFRKRQGGPLPYADFTVGVDELEYMRYPAETVRKALEEAAPRLPQLRAALLAARERLLLGYGDAPLRYNMSLARGADTLLRAVGQLICPRNPASLSSCIGEQAGTGATVFF